jgi:hypothetical protein
MPQKIALPLNFFLEHIVLPDPMPFIATPDKLFWAISPRIGYVRLKC